MLDSVLLDNNQDCCYDVQFRSDLRSICGGGLYVWPFYSGFVTLDMGLFAPMIGSLTRKDSEIGARMGICFTFTGLGGLVGTPVAGALLTSSYIWWKPILFAGLCTSCGALLFACARIGVARYKGTQKV
ncbi:hypothetical protein DFS33DRAFT_830202 [Desarmillaria ectypa]|nr:hypothetical protein DFS33DRAFT_830202 [Desarmillaria ectypa]